MQKWIPLGYPRLERGYVQSLFPPLSKVIASLAEMRSSSIFLSYFVINSLSDGQVLIVLPLRQGKLPLASSRVLPETGRLIGSVSALAGIFILNPENRGL